MTYKILLLLLLFALYLIINIVSVKIFTYINNKNTDKIYNKKYFYYKSQKKVEKLINKNLKEMYNFNNKRYHFKERNYEKIFKTIYSYEIYQRIDKAIPYDENGNNIYSSTGMLNLTLLDYYYYGTKLDILNLNHIHLSMSFDKNYIFLSCISIASILNTSNINTFIHFHIILNNCSYYDLKPLFNLKKINKKVDFIFYNGKQAEYDFRYRPKTEHRGIGEYTRLLIPKIINNTDKVLILDSADIIVSRDLSELYYFDLKDNYFAVSLDFVAGGSNPKNYFSKNNFYFNGGVILINVTKYNEDNLYFKAYLTTLAYNFFSCPYQDILLFISNFQFKYFPLNYNCPQFFENDVQMNSKKVSNKIIRKYLKKQKFTPFKYSKKEIIKAALNPVINHLIWNKPYKNKANNRFTKIWINYAKMIGLDKILKKTYPLPFKKVGF